MMRLMYALMIICIIINISSLFEWSNPRNDRCPFFYSDFDSCNWMCAQPRCPPPPPLPTFYASRWCGSDAHPPNYVNIVFKYQFSYNEDIKGNHYSLKSFCKNNDTFLDVSSCLFALRIARTELVAAVWWLAADTRALTTFGYHRWAALPDNSCAHRDRIKWPKSAGSCCSVWWLRRLKNAHLG